MSHDRLSAQFADINPAWLPKMWPDRLLLAKLPQQDLEAMLIGSLVVGMAEAGHDPKMVYENSIVGQSWMCRLFGNPDNGWADTPIMAVVVAARAATAYASSNAAKPNAICVQCGRPMVDKSGGELVPFCSDRNCEDDNAAGVPCKPAAASAAEKAGGGEGGNA